MKILVKTKKIKEEIIIILKVKHHVHLYIINKIANTQIYPIKITLIKIYKIKKIYQILKNNLYTKTMNKICMV